MNQSQEDQNPRNDLIQNQQGKQNNIVEQQNLKQPNQQAQKQSPMEIEQKEKQIENNKADEENQQQQQEQEGQIQGQQGQQQNQEIIKDQAQSTLHSKAIDKDAYINRLQISMNKLKSQITSISKKLEQTGQENKKTKQLLKKTRFQALSSKQQISSLNQQKQSLQKQKQNIQNLNNKLNEQLQTYKQAGDVNYFKNKIVQLEHLVEIQKQQLEMRSKMIDQRQEVVQTQLQTQKSKVQIIELIDNYEAQNKSLKQKMNLIGSLNQQLQSKIQWLENKNKQLALKQIESINEVLSHKDTIQQVKNQLSSKQTSLNRKIKELQSTILAYSTLNNQNQRMSDRVIPKAISKSAQEKYGIKVLTPSEERDILLKQFIQLDILHQSLTSELSSIRQRHYNTLKQIKNMSSTHIQKKDYTQLYNKYAKLRKCLQNSLLNEQALNRQLLKYKNLKNSNIILQSQQNQEAGRRQSSYRNLLLQQPQNALSKIQKIVQKSQSSFKQFYTLKQQLQTKQKLIKSEKQLRQKQQKLLFLQKQVQRSANMIQLYDKQLTYKNNEIQLLRKSNQQNLEKIYNFQSNYISKHYQNQLFNQLQNYKITNEILEIKNIQTLKQNHLLTNQKNYLNSLYLNVKRIYEQIVNKQPQLIQQQEKNKSDLGENNIGIQLESNQPCKKCLEHQQFQKNRKFIDQQTETTQQLSEVYYKQIKQLLTILKKFPRKIDGVIASIQSEKATVQQIKKKYDRAITSLEAKGKLLDEQKKSNDQWRLKQKQQIRQEFQQVRQLLLNQRLLSALRRAKSLIQSYEDPQGEQNPQAGQEEDPIQKDQGILEQPIQQQKPNQ